MNKQHRELTQVAQSRSLPAGYVFRAKLILMLNEDATFAMIREGLGQKTYGFSLERTFVASDLDGLERVIPGNSRIG